MVTKVIIEAVETLTGQHQYRIEVQKDGTPVSVKTAVGIHAALDVARGEVTFSPTAESVRAADTDLSWLPNKGAGIERRLAQASGPQLPAGIDWTEPGVWGDFRAAYSQHVAKQVRIGFPVLSIMPPFKFSGLRFVPSFAKLLLDAYAPKDGE